MQALILAAGYAMRLAELTANFPKALLKLGQRPMTDYILDKLSEIPEIKTVHVVSNHRFAPFFVEWADELAARNAYPGFELRVWDDGTTSNDDRRGAIGDIQYVIEQANLDDDLFVLCGDNYFTFSLADMYNEFARDGHDLVCASHFDDLSLLRGYGVATLDDENRVISMVEKPETPPTDIGVHGIYLYKRETLPLFAQYLADGNPKDAPGNFPSWLYRRKTVKAFLCTGECHDIGTKASYFAIQARFVKR